jgi:hypothetical protein
MVRSSFARVLAIRKACLLLAIDAHCDANSREMHVFLLILLHGGSGLWSSGGSDMCFRTSKGWSAESLADYNYDARDHEDHDADGDGGGGSDGDDEDDSLGCDAAAPDNDNNNDDGGSEDDEMPVVVVALKMLLRNM